MTRNRLSTACAKSISSYDKMQARCAEIRRLLVLEISGCDDSYGLCDDSEGNPNATRIAQRKISWSRNKTRMSCDAPCCLHHGYWSARNESSLSCAVPTLFCNESGGAGDKAPGFRGGDGGRAPIRPPGDPLRASRRPGAA